MNPHPFPTNCSEVSPFSTNAIEFSPFSTNSHGLQQIPTISVNAHDFQQIQSTNYFTDTTDHY
ncbi:hypothetical protein, partial [Enterococcus faecalis]|uniref:hypothetical protein n=1 Tax=Enterococcus faecalis TaxID=1351 RepID=UPI0022F01234